MLGGKAVRGLAIGALICGMAVAMGDPAAEGRNINCAPTAKIPAAPNRHFYAATDGVVVGLAIVLSHEKQGNETPLPAFSPQRWQDSRFASAD
jgi:hypothetical protein